MPVQVPLINSAAASSSSRPVSDESVTVQQLRGRIARMEKDLTVIHAGAAIAKKKGELALEFGRYAQEELTRATEGLHCKHPMLPC